MIFSRTLLVGLGLGLTTAAVRAQTPAPAPTAAPTAAATPPAPLPAPAPVATYPRTSLGLSFGWGAPYGWGLDFSYLVASHLDVSVGAGATITGTKLGVGARYYFAPTRQISPFVGANLVRSGGINDLRVTSNSNSGGGYGSTADEAVVNIKASGLAHLRGGLRWQPSPRFGLLGALGYGVVLGGDPVEYVKSPALQSTRTAVNIFSPGGVEYSLGLSFGLGHD